MAIKFLAKVEYNDIYQIKTTSGRNIKISVSATGDDDDEVWKADIFIPQTGEWKCFMTERKIRCGSFDNFLKKLDSILTED